MTESDFQRQVLDRLTKIEAKIDSYDKVKEQVYQNQRDISEITSRTSSQDEQLRIFLENQAEKIEKLEDTNKWLSRTVGGIIIGIVIAVIVGGLRIGLGV